MTKIDTNTFFTDELALIEEKGLTRTLRAFDLINKEQDNTDDINILNMSSNDYLNLSTRIDLKSASITAVEGFGCGATASRLVSGNLSIHNQLEKELAKLVGNETSLVFGSGFLANIGVLNAIAGRNDLIFADKLNHASLIDGMLLSGAKCQRYRHNDMLHLEKLLKKSSCSGHKIIVSDSLFSMDGDIAPLNELIELAEKYNAILIIDEAHAVGVFGQGGGLCKELGLNGKPDIILGTLSKAFGGYGGFAVCSEVIKKFLINRARSFIYSTGLPPACIGSALEAIKLISADFDLGRSLLTKSRKFHTYLVELGFNMPGFESQILPIHVGDNNKAVKLSQLLLDRYGILGIAIRPPTVPVGTARLRLTVTLAHSDEELKRVADSIKKCSDELGII